MSQVKVITAETSCVHHQRRAVSCQSYHICPCSTPPTAVQMDFPVLNLGMFGQTDASKARKLPRALEHLRAQALAGAPTSWWISFLAARTVRSGPLPLTYPKLPFLAVLRESWCMPCRLWLQGHLCKLSQALVKPVGHFQSWGLRGPPASHRPSNQRQDRVHTLLLTAYWQQTALSLRGSLLPWPIEESEEDTAPDTMSQSLSGGCWQPNPYPAGQGKR